MPAQTCRAGSPHMSPRRAHFHRLLKSCSGAARLREVPQLARFSYPSSSSGVVNVPKPMPSRRLTVDVNVAEVTSSTTTTSTAKKEPKLSPELEEFLFSDPPFTLKTPPGFLEDKEPFKQPGTSLPMVQKEFTLKLVDHSDCLDISNMLRLVPFRKITIAGLAYSPLKNLRTPKSTYVRIRGRTVSPDFLLRLDTRWLHADFISLPNAYLVDCLRAWIDGEKEIRHWRLSWHVWRTEKNNLEYQLKMLDADVEHSDKRHWRITNARDETLKLSWTLKHGRKEMAIALESSRRVLGPQPEPRNLFLD